MRSGAGDLLRLADTPGIAWTLGEDVVEFSAPALCFEGGVSKGVGRAAVTDGGLYFVADDGAVALHVDLTSVFDGALVAGADGAVAVVEGVDGFATFKLPPGRAAALAAAAGVDGPEEISLGEWQDKVSADAAALDELRAASFEDPPAAAHAPEAAPVEAGDATPEPLAAPETVPPADASCEAPATPEGASEAPADTPSDMAVPEPSASEAPADTPSDMAVPEPSASEAPAAPEAAPAAPVEAGPVPAASDPAVPPAQNAATEPGVDVAADAAAPPQAAPDAVPDAPEAAAGGEAQGGVEDDPPHAEPAAPPAEVEGFAGALPAQEEVARVRLEAAEAAARADVRLEKERQWHYLCRDKTQAGYAEFRQLEQEVTHLRHGLRESWPEGRLLTARDNVAIAEAAARDAVLREEGESVGRMLMAFVMSAAAAWLCDKKSLTRHTVAERTALSDDARCQLEKFMLSNERADLKMAHALKIVASSLDRRPPDEAHLPPGAGSSSLVSPQCSGHLLKANATGSAWHKRFFVLTHGRLFMMRHEHDGGERVVFEAHRIKQVELETYNDWSSSMIVRPPVGNLASRLGFYVLLHTGDAQPGLVHFCALVPQDRVRWMTQLRQCIDTSWKISPVLGSPIRHYREHSKYLHLAPPALPPFTAWVKASAVLESVSPRRSASPARASPERLRALQESHQKKAQAKADAKKKEHKLLMKKWRDGGPAPPKPAFR